MKSLETLDVGFNSIKAPGINILMKAVADTDQIRSLSMSGNALDLPSARAVAYALAYNQSLKSIHLVHCSINPEARRYITAGAVSNPLTSLRVLTGFDMGRKSCKLYCLPSAFIYTVTHVYFSCCLTPQKLLPTWDFQAH